MAANIDFVFPKSLRAIPNTRTQFRVFWFMKFIVRRVNILELQRKYCYESMPLSTETSSVIYIFFYVKKMESLMFQLKTTPFMG